MVNETAKSGNQLIIKHSSSLRTKTSKLAQKNKHTYYNNNFQIQTNPTAPIVMENCFTVLHQNTRGMRNKTIELIGFMLPKLPQIVCLTGHHLKELEVENLSMDYYTLGAKFCRKNLKQGGTSTFVHESLDFNNTDLQKYCIEQEIETCAINIDLSATHIYVISIYRSPTGNFVNFIKGLETILNLLYKPNIEIIICGDINVNYLDENCNKKRQLDTLLATYNLISTVRFPTRSLNGTASATDNIFIGRSHSGKYTLDSFINGLSDHDRQIIMLESIDIRKQPQETRTIRDFNKDSKQDFKNNLSYEIWDNIFGGKNVDNIFNNFHNTFLRIFYSNFHKKKSLGSQERH